MDQSSGSYKNINFIDDDDGFSNTLDADVDFRQAKNQTSFTKEKLDLIKREDQRAAEEEARRNLEIVINRNTSKSDYYTKLIMTGLLTGLFFFVLKSGKGFIAKIFKDVFTGSS